jgi:DNA-binding response OmpR family regulator
LENRVRILVIEDDAKVAGALKTGLTSEQYSVTVARTGEEGYFLATTESHDAILLDLGLPGRGGLEILASLRKQGLTLPVLVLTARDTVEDRVLGLDGGADDYLVKPFAFAELLARLRAMLRRGRSEGTSCLRLADLILDPVERSVTRGGTPVDLTAREFDLLRFLLRHQGQVVTREMLACEVWKQPVRGTPLDNVIDVHIGRIRRKIERESSPRLLHTIRGVGFLFGEQRP